MRRLIIEMGMGVDLHGRDYTKAACRAVEDALRHVSLPVLRLDGLHPEIRVTVGAARPEAVDRQAVAAMLPQAGASVSVVAGGLDVADPETGDTHVTASASVEVFLVPPSGWRLRP